jgi:hypothetical protein
MVDTLSMNGETEATTDSRLSARELPENVTLNKAELQAFPSPGTQRALKAETGKDYLAMVGPDADSADRTQTQVWTKLRKSIPGLKWSECEEVGLLIDDTEGMVTNPPALASFAPSPPSADSGE